MAKIKLGALAQQVSGSIGGQTYSRNRYGAYVRARVIPVKSSSVAALNARAVLSAMSSAWGSLTDAGRLAWTTWCQNNPITDRLGDKQILAGNAAFTMLNSRLLHAGDSPITVPPNAAAPTALSGVTATWDIGAGDFEFNFTDTIGADERIFCRAAVVDSDGVEFVTNQLKLVFVTAKAVVTGVDLQSEIEARFGALAVGMSVHLFLEKFDSTTGLISQPVRVQGVVVST